MTSAATLRHRADGYARHESSGAAIPAGHHSTAVPDLRDYAAAERYSDLPIGWHTRLSGIMGTAMIGAVLLAGALFTWRAVRPVSLPPQDMVTVALKAQAASPDPVHEVPDGPEQVEQQEQKIDQKERPELPQIALQRPGDRPAEPPHPAEQVKAADPVPETTAPRSVPAPPAAQAASDAKTTWEAKLLAHLQKYRRYPARSRAAGEQGVVYVTFRMTRSGGVLSASVQRGSGFRNLDQAALDMLKRAQPLPAIPKDRPEPLDLTLPVEFFVGK